MSDYRHSQDRPVTEEESSEGTDRLRRVKIYDFLRPDRFTPKEIDLLAELGNDYAARLQDLLPPSIRDGYTVRLSSVDQLRADEYYRGLGNPDTLALLTFRIPGCIELRNVPHPLS